MTAPPTGHNYPSLRLSTSSQDKLLHITSILSETICMHGLHFSGSVPACPLNIKKANSRKNEVHKVQLWSVCIRLANNHTLIIILSISVLKSYNRTDREREISEKDTVYLFKICKDAVYSVNTGYMKYIHNANRRAVGCVPSKPSQKPYITKGNQFQETWVQKNSAIQWWCHNWNYMRILWYIKWLKLKKETKHQKSDNHRCFPSRATVTT